MTRPRSSKPRTIATEEEAAQRVRAHRDAGGRIRAADRAAEDRDRRSGSWEGEGTCQLETLPPDKLAEIVEQAIERWTDLDALA